jgi:acyl carrier protein
MKNNEIRLKLLSILKKVCQESFQMIDDERSIYQECGLDSIQFVEFMLIVEKIFDVKLSDNLLDKIGEASINDFIEEINNLEKSKK